MPAIQASQVNTAITGRLQLMRILILLLQPHITFVSLSLMATHRIVVIVGPVSPSAAWQTSYI